jgi:hypothetical protein
MNVRGAPNREVTVKDENGDQAVKHYGLRSSKLLILFGIRKNCLISGSSLLCGVLMSLWLFLFRLLLCY